MNKKIGVIYGDLRNIRLAEVMAKEGYYIYTFGLEKYNFSNNLIVKCNTIEEIRDKCEYIISAIPFSKDGIYLEGPYSNKKNTIIELFNKIENKTLIAGAINNEILQEAEKNNIKIIDLLKDEELTVLNVIPTVEGAIKIAIEETEYTINGSKCLILGFGRIGKLLAKSLDLLGASVYCMARKDSDIAWIKAYGFSPIHLNDLEDNLKNNYNIIFNTIPYVILDKKRLEIIKEYKPLIIELASKPWGIDFINAQENGIKVIKAGGLPGKVAPLTSAINIKNVIEKRENTWQI